MARCFGDRFSDRGERRNWTNRWVRAKVLPDPADALSTVTLRQLERVSRSRTGMHPDDSRTRGIDKAQTARLNAGHAQRIHASSIPSYGVLGVAPLRSLLLVLVMCARCRIPAPESPDSRCVDFPAIARFLSTTGHALRAPETHPYGCGSPVRSVRPRQSSPDNRIAICSVFPSYALQRQDIGSGAPRTSRNAHGGHRLLAARQSETRARASRGIRDAGTRCLQGYPPGCARIIPW